MNILICTIMRNTGWFFDQYHAQINSLVKRFGGENNFWLSIYENDSTDDTKEKLSTAEWIGFEGINIVSEDVGTQFFGSVADAKRVQNLAIARNMAMETIFLDEVDYVLFIDADIIYDLSVMKRLMENVREYDIFSPLSRSAKHNSLLADAWAVRLTKDCVNCLEFKENRGLHLSKEIIDVWSTYNGFCFYRAKPLREGHIFHWVNDRKGLDWDCEMAVICERFIANGYNKIAIDTSKTIDWA